MTPFSPLRRPPAGYAAAKTVRALPVVPPALAAPRPPVPTDLVPIPRPGHRGAHRRPASVPGSAVGMIIGFLGYLIVMAAMMPMIVLVVLYLRVVDRRWRQ